MRIKLGSSFESSVGNEGYDYIFCSIIIGLMFIPLNTMGYIIRIITVLMIFSFKVINNRMKMVLSKSSSLVIKLMLIGSVISLFSVWIIDWRMDYSWWKHETIRLLFNILLIALIPNLRISFDYICKSSVLLILFHTGIQIVQRIQLFDINTFLRRLYEDPEETRSHLILTEYEGASFRSGSIFINPNVYMIIPCIILCVFLQRNIIKSSIVNYVFCLIAIVSLFLTGSRTTLIVFVLILLLYLFGNSSTKLAERILITIIIIACSLYVVAFRSDLLSSYRVFNLTNAFERSLGIKLKLAYDYLTSSNVIYWLFGNLGSTGVGRVQIDTDVGYVFEFYGLWGCVWYYLLMLKNTRNKVNELKFFQTSIRGVSLLIGLSASVFFCMPIFPYVCFMILADIELKPQLVSKIAKGEIND